MTRLDYRRAPRRDGRELGSARGGAKSTSSIITAESQVVTAGGAAVPVSGTRVAAACELHEISLFLSGPVMKDRK